LLDVEHCAGGRITVERGGRTAPLSISCGVYGWMVHTRFFPAESEAQREFAEMKRALSELMATLDDGATDPAAARASCARFCERFP
jgi:hypothetical protein